MVVNSHNIEFGYELLSAVPCAYDLYLKGQLTETISGPDTESLYYFSPKHTINNSQRSWYNTEAAKKSGLPFTCIHSIWPEQKVFPPYADIFANDEYKFDKPTLCICNRYNVEWGYRPINYFSESILDWLFSNLKHKYEIIYFPVSIPEEFYDGVKPLKLNDIAVARKHDVKVFTDLCSSLSWNETMLKVFANCKHYITMNGGYSILASMFNGTNLIYSKPGKIETREIKNKSFWRWYPNINNVRTIHVPSYSDLQSKVSDLYIDDKPCVNVLIRTHRPNYLASCMSSIRKQTYPNINVVLICDSSNAIKYTMRHDARVIRVNSKKYTLRERPASDEYGISFVYNKYLDTAQRLVDGYIIMLDDDDMFMSNDSIDTIMKHVNKNSLVIWKVDLKKACGIIPSFSFGKQVTLYDITGIGFCYHSCNVNMTDWSEWKRADFRTAKKLEQNLNTVWIDAVLTSIQDYPGNGTKPDKTTLKQVELIYPDKTVTQYFSEEEMPGIVDYFKRANIEINILT